MNSIEQWKNTILSGDLRPVIPIMTHPGIELCGKIVREAVTKGEVHAEAICKLNATYPASASTAIMDLTVEAEAFGAKIVFPEDEVPSVVEPIVSDMESVEALQIPSLEAGRVQEYLKADRLVAQSIQDKPVFAGCIGPFSLAGRLMGMTEIMIALFTEPEAVEMLLEKCTAFLRAYCHAIKETGVDGVIMAEPAAGLISNEDCTKYSSEYVRPLIEELQDDTFLFVMHNCGNGGHCTEAMVASGAGALHFGNRIDMLEALEHTPSHLLAMGNLDPVGILKQAAPEIVYNETLQLLEKTATYKNYVLSTGCDVPPHIPEENIKAFYQAMEDFKK